MNEKVVFGNISYDEENHYVWICPFKSTVGLCLDPYEAWMLRRALLDIKELDYCDANP